jgi:hypothetical protein
VLLVQRNQVQFLLRADAGKDGRLDEALLLGIREPRRVAQVGGDDIAAVEDHDIAGDDLLGGDRLHLTVAPHRRFGVAHLLERLHRPHRAQFGEEADAGIDQNGDNDGDAFDDLPKREGRYCCNRPQADDQAPELLDKNLSCAALLSLAQAVGADLLEALAGKKGAQHEAIGQSRGGLSSKIHLRVEGRGKPMTLQITPGQQHESTVFAALLDDGAVKRPRGGRPRLRPPGWSATQATAAVAIAGICVAQASAARLRGGAMNDGAVRSTGKHIASAMWWSGASTGSSSISAIRHDNV